MKILNKISIQNLKLNKKRTISTIIGIILSCALICAIATMVTSFRATLIENAINETGYYHLKIINIKEQELKELENNRKIKNIYTKMENGGKDAYISLKDIHKYKTDISEILGTDDYNELEESEDLKYEQFEINRELLRWEAFAFSDTTVLMLYEVAAVVIFIIIFTSVFCIRNSFAIAMTEKMKMYGMLSSIGATKKQIKKNVIFEALILGIIAIPLGILFGILAVIILIKIVNQILGEHLLNHVDGICINISILAIILAIVLGFITIYLSAISSARKASRIEPINLLKNSDELKIKSKQLKIPQIITKLFKTGGVLAYKNLKRSRKKYRTTVISIAISIFIFIAMDSFLANTFNLTNNYYEDYDYNVEVFCREISEQDIEKITKLNNIDEYFMLYEGKDDIEINDLSKVNETSELQLIEDGDYDEEKQEFIPSGKGKVSHLQIVALDNESFSKYVNKIGLNEEKIKNTGILCDTYLYYRDSGKQVETRRYKYSTGDVIKGELEDKEIDIKVGAVTKTKPYGLEQTYYDGGYLVVNIDEYKDIDFEPVCMTIQSNAPQALIKQIESSNIDNIRYTDLEEAAKEEKSMILVIKIFIYGFIIVIILIGITNIFNTITSNIELRQKEFAMLKSIGMTKKEFNRMVNLETIFYSTKSLIYGITLGLLGALAIHKAFSTKIESAMYIPIKAIIISIIAVFILVFIIMKYSISKINKQNIIETIRNENI